MFDSFPSGPVTRLDRQKYHADFYRIQSSGIRQLRKLERGQHFAERGFASWEAFQRGEWEEALSLIEERRHIYAQQIRENAERGIRQRRLRVVEFPVTPYVQWELHVLRVRVEVGDDIRAIDARDIASVERDRPVPEMVILGDTVLYEVIYDDQGNADGANRFTDRALIEEAAAGFDALFARGEALPDFVDRKIAPLPPPSVDVTAGRAPGS
ncbi:DUF6879 family protein [Streptomyces millisiae]|uniref:DUF6879 domain-containing protein n=1 Tax=Streptomyces millisiae TaxID=3075542 RepID=A0ABU2LVD0_9ACTN|nr:DUF6879 family protein [Streptomyces sp. DSM 44918]MDT0321550.1 hypothetical protein [Streptomyces sp. DSM 44918]